LNWIKLRSGGSGVYHSVTFGDLNYGTYSFTNKIMTTKMTTVSISKRYF